MKTYLMKVTLSLLLIILTSSCSFPQRGDVVILCTGDSITAADYPRFLQEIFGREGIKAEVLNYGRRGNTSREYLRFLEWNENTLAKTHPDFILLQLGTNDVRVDRDNTSGEEFYSNMKKIIEIFREFRNGKGEETRMLLATIPPIPEGTLFPFSLGSRARVTDEINPIIKRISSEEKIPLVDNYSLFLRFPHLLPEVHPNREGYRVLAQNWQQALKPLIK